MAMSLVCFTRWRRALHQQAETQVQDLEASGGVGMTWDEYSIVPVFSIGQP